MAKEFFFGSDQVTKEELLFTYRKVKRELYYERDYHYLEKVVAFEENLVKNINFLYKNINSKAIRSFLQKDLIGEANFVFKSIKSEAANSKLKVKGTISNIDRGLINVDDVDFRFLGEVSIYFQVIGGLWLNRIGYKLDENFPSNLYGCRLKRKDKSLSFPYYKQNHTLYKPYFSNYQKWQNDLFDSIDLRANKDILVLTADFSKYYHSIKVDLLKKKAEKLLTKLNIKLNRVDKFIHELLFSMISFFNKENNLKYSWFKENDLLYSEFGLPLTLNASKLLSNLYLLDFDRDIINNLKPIYYGRYVDDIILAIELGDERTDDLCISKVLNKRLDNFSIKENNLKENEHRDFNLKFNIEKESVFILNNSKDRVELNNLRRAINKNSSEWNLLPVTQEYDKIDNIDLSYSINEKCDETTGIRKSSSLVIKRNKFVREIISFETSIRNYEHRIWKKRLNNFLSVTFDYIFEIKNFIDLIKYVPRVFGLLVHSSDEELSRRFYFTLLTVLEKIDSSKNIDKTQFSIAKMFLMKKIEENIIYSNSITNVDNEFLVKCFSTFSISFKENVIRYFRSDLHMIPYKTCYFKYDFLRRNLECKLDEKEIKLYTKTFFNRNIIDFVNEELKLVNEKHDENTTCYKISSNTGFYFFTRRITLLELSISFKNCIVKKNKEFTKLAEKYYHKYNLKIRQGDGVDIPKGYDYIQFPETKKTILPRICNTHFKTIDQSYDAHVRSLTEPDITRNDRFFNIINDIIKRRHEVDYVIFHELSLPRHLYVQVAEKLGRININLIAGLEYKIDRIQNRADNQLFYSLTVDDSMTGSIGLFQSKLIPAIHEGSELYNRAALNLYPDFNNKFIIKHKNFVFSGLVCNDLLDINNRSALRGKIDSLFIVAWNQDIETYHHLVKSSTLDIHCYIALCNNKIYGDVKISAPYKKSWKRDLHIIHGGKFDNFMISDLDIGSLRNYQNNKVPPAEPFKPFPTGFELWEERKDNIKK
ncbi:RNA-dependent RNA polymerase family protein [Chryseobacterium paridis]|uniref:RNA-directed DNA polymerase n=1 Tax=Chryseobacterium paridis TaxID=2800328 RepID=A0ABS1FY13_9FLAO|nr:hypothetical protein [Chryseobacterium paridis]MBK1897309.1 hypothetical protein [Chryseobacterium paridis]